MEEIKSLIKKDEKTINEINSELALLAKQNFATKDLCLQQSTAQNIIYKKTLRIVGEQMIDYEEEIEQKDNIIEEFKNRIGDDKINEEVTIRGREQTLKEYDPEKIRHKNKVIARLKQRVASAIE